MKILETLIIVQLVKYVGTDAIDSSSIRPKPNPILESVREGTLKLRLHNNHCLVPYLTNCTYLTVHRLTAINDI